MAQHTLVKHPLVVRRVEVVRIVDVTPRMRRVTVSGPELSTFFNGEFELPGFVSSAFDDHIKLVFAADGDIAAALPVQRARSIDWPPSDQRQGRDYTVRRWDPGTGELELDFVRHGHGPAADWAANARPGDTLFFAGPKSSLVLPADIDWVVLAGDETALPAIGRFLEERPVDAPVRVVVEVRDDTARQDLALADGDTIRWVVTDERAPSALSAAVQELAWLPGRPYVWVAGESRSLIPLRNWLRRDREVPPSQVNVTGYWHAQPDTPQAPHDGQGASTTDAETLLSPLPWLATRAATDLGLLDMLSSTPRTLAELGVKVGVDAENLYPLVAYLDSLEVLVVDDRGVTVGPVGEELAGDDHLRDELFGTGFEARALQALSNLGPALREGTSAWVRSTGRTLADEIECDPRLYADRVDAAENFGFVAAGVADLPAWKHANRVLITGPAALVLVDAVTDVGTVADIVITGNPVPLRVLTARAKDTAARLVTANEAGTADLVVSTLQMRYRTDSELGTHLGALTRFGDRVLLIDALQRTGPGSPDAAAEHDLLEFAGTANQRRTSADIEAIAGIQGFTLVHQVALGWDYEVFELHKL